MRVCTERVPLTFEAVDRVMREYLHSKSAQTGPDYGDWLARCFRAIQQYAKRSDSIAVGTLTVWADRYRRDMERHSHSDEAPYGPAGVRGVKAQTDRYAGGG
jgi:hypothetical protein